MGAGDSRSVSYGLDEEENVTVLQGVKLSNDVFQRMRQSGPSLERPASPKPESAKSDPGSARPSAADRQEELRRRYERKQALVQDELSRISRRERETAGTEREELKNTKDLPAELCFRARQLRKKEDELKHLAEFYKEQLQLMDQKNSDFYQQTLQMYSQDAVKTESAVGSCNISPICSELQSQVLNCYRENKHQTLHCSQLARQYINCINSSKKNLLVNDG